MSEFLQNSPERVVNRETRKSGIKLADLINSREVYYSFKDSGEDKNLMKDDERLYPNVG